MGLRSVANLVSPAARDTDPASAAPAVDPASGGPDILAGWVVGDPSDAAGAASVAGWSAAPGLPPVPSPTNPTQRLPGLDGRLGAWTMGSAMAELSSVPAAIVAANVALPTVLPWDVPMSDDLRRAESSPILIAAAEADDRGWATDWGGLLEDGLRADWEAVDGELRRFLSRLGGVPASPEGRGEASVWRVWIAAATLLVLARRASTGRRGRVRQPASGGAWAAAHGPGPVAPWPMGPP
jgi:hypothetical protein